MGDSYDNVHLGVINVNDRLHAESYFPYDRIHRAYEIDPVSPEQSTLAVSREGREPVSRPARSALEGVHWMLERLSGLNPRNHDGADEGPNPTVFTHPDLKG
jgi:hypothetical protein